MLFIYRTAFRGWHRRDIHFQRFGLQLRVRPNRGHGSVSDGHLNRHRGRAAWKGGRKLVGAAHRHRDRWKLRSSAVRHRVL